MPDTSKAKIKLWAYKGALKDGNNESFAARFSIKMWKSGYQQCQIFGYNRSVFQKYLTDGSDEYHKWAAVDTSTRTPDELIELAIQGTSKDSLRAKMIWEAELKSCAQRGQDASQAIANILASQYNIMALIDVHLYRAHFNVMERYFKTVPKASLALDPLRP